MPPKQPVNTANGRRFDGLERKSTVLLSLIDRHFAAHDVLPRFKDLRELMPQSDESSIWAYLFELRRCGSIELALSCRAPEISRRVAS